MVRLEMIDPHPLTSLADHAGSPCVERNRSAGPSLWGFSHGTVFWRRILTR